MKSNLKWLWGMCVPVLVFGGLAAYLSRAKPTTPPRDEGPFQLVVEGVRPRKVTPMQISRGHNFAFELLLKSRGQKPDWWGQPIGGAVGTGGDLSKNTPCRLVAIESKGVRRLDEKFTYWTTQWNDALQRYTALIEIAGDKIPRDKAMRWQGHIAISESNNPPVSPSVRYDVVLKKAGEVWIKPQVSREPKVTVRSVRLTIAQPSPQTARQLEARVTVFSPDGELQSFWREKYVDAHGKEFQFDLRDENGWLISLSGSTRWWQMKPSADGLSSSQNVGDGVFTWNVPQLLQAPRDIFVVGRASAHDRWPMEFAFPIKRDGKILRGNVPVETRSAPTKRD